jgi:DNA-binding transcriptional ArsR family regulator
MTKKATSSNIQWDFGMAYEFFISLHVLHSPDYYGIRPSYAAGVRSRIPAIERKLLEDVYTLTGVPLKWIHNLPAPKDAISALWALKQISPAQRMIRLQLDDSDNPHGIPEEIEKRKKFNETLLRVSNEGKWQSEDLEFLQSTFSKKQGRPKRGALERALDWWSRPDELGEGFLSALQAYYQSFFEEEEKRIGPILQTGLDHAQSLAPNLSVEELFFELSQGVQLGDEFKSTRYVFAPAFWTTPLIFFERFDKDTLMVIFGARPAEMSVIPGESLPDGLVRSLKALADPTRLKILYYLSKENLTPSELARRLHLRAPTVTHHLSELRLASLVNLIPENQERKYALRRAALNSTFTNLQDFLNAKE